MCANRTIEQIENDIPWHIYNVTESQLLGGGQTCKQLESNEAENSETKKITYEIFVRDGEDKRHTKINQWMSKNNLKLESGSLIWDAA